MLAVLVALGGLLNWLLSLFNSCFGVQYINNRLRERKKLIDQLSKLRSNLVQVEDSISKIDQHLTLSVLSLEKSKEYPNMEDDMLIICNKCITVINKYNKIIGNEASWTTDTVTTGNQQPSSTTETEDLSDAHIVNVHESELEFFLREMIRKLRELEHTMPGELENMKWPRHPLKNWELAECSRDIAENVKLAIAVRDRLKVEHMTTKRNKIHLKKRTEVANVLPVFNVYATKVVNSLRPEGKSIVGIHGLPGVGKTTLLKRLNNRVIEDGLQFQHIIWIDFPLEKEENEIYEKMQVEIMRQLYISHEATTSTTDNQDKISTFLNAKKYLLIMDQVSRRVDLDRLVGLRDDHNGMNVVIASSDEKFFPVTNEVFQIHGLSEEHAWELFKKVYGEEIDDGDLIAIGKMIVQCCGGIPIYINTMAAYLRKTKRKSKSIIKSVWMDAKRMLKSHSKTCNFLDLAGFDKMYEQIYLDIQDISAMKCLLYGALFPIQHNIYKDYLVECWIAEGFIDVPDKRLQSYRDRGETTLVRLTGTFLMEWCSGEKYVKMHPIFRRVALELYYRDDQSKNFNIWIPYEVHEPNQNDQTACTRMSMIGSETELPEIPKCYDIYTLLLQKKANLNSFKHRFFDSMPKLKVLDLYKTNIEALPESIEVLINLKGLYLNGCRRLENLPPQAAKLVVLEFLDIRSTKISSLPKEIGSMVNLRCLRASLYMKISNRNTKGKEVVDLIALVPPNILNRLEKLEELIIDSDQIDDQCWADMAESLQRELTSLKYLTKFDFNFPKVKKCHKLDIERNLPRKDVASTSEYVEEDLIEEIPWNNN